MPAPIDYVALHARSIAVLKLGEKYDTHQVADLLGVKRDTLTQWWSAVDGITECGTVKSDRGGSPRKVFRAHDVREFLAMRAAKQKQRGRRWTTWFRGGAR